MPKQDCADEGCEGEALARDGVLAVNWVHDVAPVSVALSDRIGDGFPFTFFSPRLTSKLRDQNW